MYPMDERMHVALDFEHLCIKAVISGLDPFTLTGKCTPKVGTVL